jgi:hypothetical protein
MTWRSASYSASSGNCVQVRGDLAAIRDSKIADGPALTAPALRVFVQDVKAGRFDR